MKAVILLGCSLTRLTFGLGDRAGGVNSDGYVRLKIDGKRYLAHRLAWLFETGAFPLALMDHIDGNRSNNRISNLREASLTQNGANQKVHADNKLGVKGVVLSRSKKSFGASIEVRGKKIHLGHFKTIEEASSAYITAAKEHFGEFARA